MGAELLQGRKGTGKSKRAVMLIREHLSAGNRVATNLDIYLDKLMPPDSRATVLRIPDKPSARDLEACGSGTKAGGDRYNEEHDGLMVLDELATWLNARTFQDKERGPVLDWLVHSRKLNWGTLLICQDLVQVDKQVREAHVDYVTRCIRLDKVRIPFVGGIIAALFGEKASYLPNMHRATRRLGCDPNGLTAGQVWYRGGKGTVGDGYDTLQVFRHNYEHGPHSLLSAWHLVGRHLPPKLTIFQRIAAWWRAAPAAQRLGGMPPKLPIVASIQALPPDERIRHVRRLERLGLLAPVPQSSDGRTGSGLVLAAG